MQSISSVHERLLQIMKTLLTISRHLIKTYWKLLVTRVIFCAAMSKYTLTKALERTEGSKATALSLVSKHYRPNNPPGLMVPVSVCLYILQASNDEAKLKL